MKDRNITPPWLEPGFKFLAACDLFFKQFNQAPALRDEVFYLFLDYCQFLENEKLPINFLIYNLFKKNALPPRLDLSHVAFRVSVGVVYIFNKENQLCFSSDNELDLLNFDDPDIDQKIANNLVKSLELAFGVRNWKSLGEQIYGLLDLKARRFQYSFELDGGPLEFDNYANVNELLVDVSQQFRRSKKNLNYQEPYKFVVVQGDFYVQTFTQDSFKKALAIASARGISSPVTFYDLESVKLKPFKLTNKIPTQAGKFGFAAGFWDRDINRTSTHIAIPFRLNTVKIVRQFVAKAEQNINWNRVLKFTRPRVFSHYSDKPLAFTFPQSCPPLLHKQFGLTKLTAWTVDWVVSCFLLEAIRNSASDPEVSETARKAVENWVSEKEKNYAAGKFINKSCSLQTLKPN